MTNAIDREHRIFRVLLIPVFALGTYFDLSWPLKVLLSGAYLTLPLTIAVAGLPGILFAVVLFMLCKMLWQDELEESVLKYGRIIVTELDRRLFTD